jgi:hypothetical protein
MNYYVGMYSGKSVEMVMYRVLHVCFATTEYAWASVRNQPRLLAGCIQHHLLS